MRPELGAIAASSAEAEVHVGVLAQAVREVARAGRDHRRAFAHLRLVAHAQAAARHLHARAGGAEACRSGLPWSARSASILVGGATHSLTGMSRLPSSSLPAARKWPMLVMHEPMNTSSILAPATSRQRLGVVRIVRAAERSARVISARSISITAAYSASASACEQLRVRRATLPRACDAALQRARVGVAVGDHVLHQHDVAGEVLDDRLLVQRAPCSRRRERSAEASLTARTPARPSGRAGPRSRGCGRRRRSSCPAWRPSAGPA